MKAYTYKIIHKSTGQFYFGSRSANIKKKVAPCEDLGKMYFSSSSNLKQMIVDQGVSNFDFTIIYESHDILECYWLEQCLIRDNIKHPNCLNRHFIDPDKGSQAFCASGIPKSDEHRRKIGASQKGVPKSQTHRENLSKAKLGVPSTISTVAKERRGIAISESNRKRKGVPRTPEVKSRLKGSTSGSANSRAKTWTIEQENGEVFTMKGIKPWCVSQGLIQSTLKRTLTTGVFYCGYRVIALN
jgi:hypothetical protein